MSELPAVQDSETILLRLSKSHDALHVEQQLYADAEKRAVSETWQKHAPHITEAQSVFLQVKAEAYRAGFTDTEITKLLSHCH